MSSTCTSRITWRDYHISQQCRRCKNLSMHLSSKAHAIHSPFSFPWMVTKQEKEGGRSCRCSPLLGAAPLTDIQTVNFLRNGSAEHCCQQCQTFCQIATGWIQGCLCSTYKSGWQSLICRKSPTKQTLFDIFSKRTNPGGIHARHPLYCRVTTMVNLIPWPLFASNVGKFSSLYLLVMPKSQQLITNTHRCGHITECITYDGVIIWPCFARDWSWVTPHISVWPHSHSIWWARTNHRRLFRRSCKKSSYSSTLWVVTPGKSPCYSQSPTVPAPRPGRAHVHT